MLLKINNPHQVALVRGNHEDIGMTKDLGFNHEFKCKYSAQADENRMRVLKKIAKFYELLPVVFYLGCGDGTITHFVQCCHGGIEIGYNPKKFLQANERFHWIEAFNRLTECSHLPNMNILERKDSKVTLPLSMYCKNFTAKSPMEPSCIGFTWTDFVVDPKGSCFVTPRALACNKELTHAVLNAGSTLTHTLTAIIRAHQHRTDDKEPIMKLLLANDGCAQLWKEGDQKKVKLDEGTVLTLLLSPDSTMGMPTNIFTGFDYDTSLIMETAEKLTDWDVKVINNEVYKKVPNI